MDRNWSQIVRRLFLVKSELGPLKSLLKQIKKVGLSVRLRGLRFGSNDGCKLYFDCSRTILHDFVAIRMHTVDQMHPILPVIDFAMHADTLRSTSFSSVEMPISVHPSYTFYHSLAAIKSSEFMHLQLAVENSA